MRGGEVCCGKFQSGVQADGRKLELVLMSPDNHISFSCKQVRCLLLRCFRCYAGLYAAWSIALLQMAPLGRELSWSGEEFPEFLVGGSWCPQGLTLLRSSPREHQEFPTGWGAELWVVMSPLGQAGCSSGSGWRGQS
jgi:hypothetical protein